MNMKQQMWYDIINSNYAQTHTHLYTHTCTLYGYIIYILPMHKVKNFEYFFQQ